MGRWRSVIVVAGLASLLGLGACLPATLAGVVTAAGRSEFLGPHQSELERIIAVLEAERDRRASYVGEIVGVDAARLGLSWRPSCPVGPDQLRLLRMSYWGFDGRGHTGEMVVNVRIARKVVDAFRSMWNEQFPINRMDTAEKFTTPADFDASGTYIEKSPGPDTVNDTYGFFCRPTTGASGFSQHAYGLALDINPVQNPYVSGPKVVPTNGAPYLVRDPVRPGMNVAGSVSVLALAAQGLKWGGRWRSLKDYMHFSLNDR